MLSKFKMRSIPIALHHFELCLKDLSFVNLLVNGYGFENWTERRTEHYYQCVLRNNHCVFIVTNRLSNGENKTMQITDDIYVKPPLSTYPALFCCDKLNEHENDTVFNVALEVKNINTITQLVKKYGGNILQETQVVEDEHGIVKYAIITPPFKNLVHTLIEKENYTGFLPGLNPPSVDKTNKWTNSIGGSHSLVEYIDHVTYVTEPGESGRIIKWYEDVFKMKRLFTNRKETREDGLVLADLIGLRLKALQYWHCAETGISAPSTNSPDHLKIVLAEPLPEVKASHVQAFLTANGGPGVQHIAFHTTSILESVSKITNAGVKFRMPPYTYYEEIIEREVLQKAGLEECLEKLEKNGILIDFEENDQSAVNYLMQIFSYPVFDRDTFFLEIIQRHGASGFGSGNISALARSIIRYQQEMINACTENKA